VVGAPFVVVDEISIQGRMHLVQGFERNLPAFDAEMMSASRSLQSVRNNS
jgi:hypothetical protein